MLGKYYKASSVPHYQEGSPMAGFTASRLQSRKGADLLSSMSTQTQRSKKTHWDCHGLTQDKEPPAAASAPIGLGHKIDTVGFVTIFPGKCLCLHSPFPPQCSSLSPEPSPGRSLKSGRWQRFLGKLAGHQ